jgi:hypothetical protein
MKIIFKVLISMILWALAWSFYDFMSTNSAMGERPSYGWPSAVIIFSLSCICTIGIWWPKETSKFFG